jgi:ubiquinone/menaquinone biosynthesis C-methylase UbiE
MSDRSPASIYERYLVSAIFEPLARIIIEHALPAPGEHVLDAACGTGIVARLIAPKVGSSGKIVGLDYDPMMIEMARSLAPEIEWRQGDLQSLPYPDGTYDLVTCQQGLQYLPDPAAGLCEIHRILRSRGRVALTSRSRWRLRDKNGHPPASSISDEQKRKSGEKLKHEFRAASALQSMKYRAADHQ